MELESVEKIARDSIPKEVNLECVKEGSRLRVKIISPGYLNAANCQFPRAIRKVGAKYTVPRSAITLSSGRAGKYFYRIKKKDITVLSEESIIEKIIVEKIFEDDDEDCVICMDRPHSLIIVPCGHYCLCAVCVSILRQGSEPRCPICRAPIIKAVTEDQIG